VHEATKNVLSNPSEGASSPTPLVPDTFLYT
jgi:hypothetical protein